MRDSYLFTVVMAAHNVEEYIGRAVQSLVDQSIGFEDNIQVVLVDDGSTDETGKLCDELSAQYPENIEVIHQENLGVAAARNAGLARVRGKYVNFLDGNDAFSLSTFKCAAGFFERYGDSVQVVTARRCLRYGSKSKHHFIRYSVGRSSRVFSLLDTGSACICLEVDATFFPASVFSTLRFNTELDFREGADVVLRVLMKNPRLGVLASSCCLYFRDPKQLSATALPACERKGYYLPFLKHYVAEILKLAGETYGYIPAYVQQSLMYDLQWHYRVPTEILERVLSPEEILDMSGLMRSQLDKFKDSIITNQNLLRREVKARLLSIKHQSPMMYDAFYDQIRIRLMDGTLIDKLYRLPVRLEFLRMVGEDLVLEGSVRLPKGDDVPYPEICLLVNGEEKAVAECTDNQFPTMDVLGEPCSAVIWFKFALPGVKELKTFDLKIALKVGGKYAVLDGLFMGRFFPITPKLRRGYCIIADHVVSHEKNGLVFRPYNIFRHALHELAFMRKLIFSRNAGSNSAAVLRCLYWLTKPFIPKDVWLVSDRINKADDNGEALFRYIVENDLHPHTYYVIRDDSPDYGKMKKIGKVIKHMSLKHLLYHLNSQWVMSSSSNRHVSLFPKEVRAAYYQDLLAKRRYCFLQHGITMNDVSRSIKRINTNMTMMVTSARGEYHSIVDNPAYGYGPEVIKLTGFPRYDRRTSEPENIIYIAPSWRTWLASSFAGFYKTGTFNVDVEQFRKSEYSMFFSALMKDPRLIAAAKEHGYRIVFVPHPSMSGCGKLIETDEYVEYVSPDLTYTDIFRTGKLMVTDYSSVFMDFAYLNKPVIYTQFDKEEFFSHHYRAGYYSYENDGFGEVEYDLESTVNRIIEYINNGCELKEKYRERINNFFAFQDQNSCKRVYEELIGLLD